MQKSKKVLLSVVGLILAVVLVYMIYYLVHYVFYNDYRKYLSSYEYETGTEFAAISETSSDVDGMVLAAENDYLKLYINTETADTAVVDKRNGQITYSNPVNADNDAKANPANKNFLKSQLIVDFFNTQRLESSFDSYTYSTSVGQYELESIENGLRVIYTIGDLSSKTGLVPQYISKATLDSIAAQLDEKSAKDMLRKFKESSVAEGYMELLESAANGPSQLRKLNKYFEQVGFTQEDYNREMEGSGVEGLIPVHFIIPLEYRLVEDALEVSVPMKGVQEFGGGSVYRIQMLRYFGAAGMDEEGYMLLPNGSGSIAYFNSGKGVAGNDYSEYVYGIDPLMAEYTVRENTMNNKMALFGLFRNDSAIFATIEDGASICNLTANLSGDVNSYNYVYPTFILRGNEKLSMFGTTGNEADLPIVEKKFYDVNLTVRYTMLEGEDADYAGAANYYRERLINEGVLTVNHKDTDIKFYYDILGGVEQIESFLGVQYRGLYPMTTFDEANEIFEDLYSKGITNQVMNYQGWSSGGYFHDVLDKVKVPRKLGGSDGLEELSERIVTNGGSLYVDSAFQKVTAVSSRYSVTNETSRYYGASYVAEFGLVNPATLRQTSGLTYDENRYYLVSPKFLVRYIDKFVDKMEDYDVYGVSLRDLGNELHSDKKRTNIINREQALDVVLGQLQILKDTGMSIMINEGNDYSFAYAEDIINAPLTDNDYYVVDETVPFYEMLIHGCIDYAGTLINIENTTDVDSIILNLIETGASPHFVFSKESPNEIKYTGIGIQLYSTTYDNWKDLAVEIYTEVNSVLKHVTGAQMVDHQILEDGVRAVTYDNGVTIYVNSGSADQTVNGVSVPAGGYGMEGVK